jgi:hypothetical protein
MNKKLYLLIVIAILGIVIGFIYYPQFFSLFQKKENKDFYRQATAVIYDFSADPTTISKGQSSMLFWSAGGGEDVGCWIDQGVSNDAGISGKKSVSPESTTTYTLECANATIMGSSVFKEVVVEVRSTK